MLQPGCFYSLTETHNVMKRWVNKTIPAHQVLKERYRHGLEYPFVRKVMKVATEKTTATDTSSQRPMRSELSQLVRRLNAM